jgi:hypothetical protein
MACGCFPSFRRLALARLGEQAVASVVGGGDAQAARWSCFEHTLIEEHLRAYLQRLPDFDDVEAARLVVIEQRNSTVTIMKSCHQLPMHWLASIR